MGWADPPEAEFYLSKLMPEGRSSLDLPVEAPPSDQYTTSGRPPASGEEQLF
jgi:hypothetical protein